MNRRDLLKALAAGAGAAIAGPAAAAGAAGLPGMPPGAAPTDLRRQRAWHNAFVDVPETYGPAEVRFEGRLPAELRGTLFRNGPARMHRGSTSYQHWFDGDGMVHAYRIRDGRLRHRAAMVRTARVVEEERAGRFLRGGFASSFAEALQVSTPDDVNVANISVLPLAGAGGAGELLALWEAGSPYRIDPTTLATRGRKVWSPETDGMPFSAHPRIDPDGTVWSFGYMPGSGKLALYQLRADGELVRTGLIDAPNADMVHDFAVTERSLVFLLMPLAYDAEGREAAFVDRYRWHGERANVLLVVEKSSWQPTLQVELPPFAFFHLGNAWEEGGTIRLSAVEVKDFAATMAEIRAATAGEPPPSQSRSRLLEVAVDVAARRAKVTATGLDATEFPAWDRRQTGLSTASHYGLVTRGEGGFGFNGVARLDWQSSRVETFHYGEEWLAEEHVFVPGPAARGHRGWLVGTAYHWPTRKTHLAVFDARSLASGPLARAQLPYGVPLGLHGAFAAG